MTRHVPTMPAKLAITTALTIVSMLSAPVYAQAAAGATTPVAQPAPSPGELVAAAPAADWITIAPSDLLIMTLSPDARGQDRQIVIQLIPAPFSQGWVANIRTLARTHWWDGLAVVRVQDNYVAQWGDPDGEDAARARALPEGLDAVPESQYTARSEPVMVVDDQASGIVDHPEVTGRRDDWYAPESGFVSGFPVGYHWQRRTVWPVHCYGMVGVGRNLSPDTGSGAELYTVIGHAPRHLDRNIALVGRVIEGMQHLSSLPRGTGPLGFYETPEERTSISAIRLASELPDAAQPHFEYLSTESDSFARYADARANRRDPFFIVPAGGADICNIPVPVRRRAAQ